MIILATLPLFLVLPVNDLVEQLYYHTFFIGLMLILTGFLLFVADKMPKGTWTNSFIALLVCSLARVFMQMVPCFILLVSFLSREAGLNLQLTLTM